MQPIPPLPRHALRNVLGLIVCASALAACSNPAPPADAPPTSQSQAAKPAAAPARGALEDYIQSPQDKARAVEPAVLEAAKQQDQAIEAQTQ